MTFPYGFYAPDEYIPWLREAGLAPVRVELLPRDITQPGTDGLAGWLRTTWLPFIERIPVNERDDFIAESAAAYLARYPLDDHGLAHVPMVRLEVEAVKNKRDD